MDDVRNQLVNDVVCRIADKFKRKEMNKIVDALNIVLNDYEVSGRTTALVPLDDNDERLLKTYIASILTEGKSKRTGIEYYRFLKRFRNRVQIPYKDVSTMNIRAYLALRQQEVSMATCKVERSYLSAFYMWLHKERYLQYNPMDNVKPIKQKTEVKIPFSDVDIDKMRSACKTLRERAEIEFLLASGVRVSEASAMNISDINYKDVYVREGKGNKERFTYINDICLEHLNKYLKSRDDDKEFLFINRLGRRMNANTIEADIRKIAARAGVEKAHPHRFRRTYASILSKRGIDVTIIQRLMGHVNITTTNGYITITQDKVKAEYAKCA